MARTWSGIWPASAAALNHQTVSQFAAGDAIDVRDLIPGRAAVTATAAATTTLLGFTDGTHAGSVTLDGAFLQTHFTAAADGHGGTLIGYA